MRAQPIVYVTDMDRSIKWYRRLLGVDTTLQSDHWTTFTLGDATVALHHADESLEPGSVALSLVCDGPVEQVVERMGQAAIATQPFGRSVDYVDPDGLRIQVNEHA